MSELKYRKEDHKIIISLSGRIDTNNASEVEKDMLNILENNKDMIPAIDAGKLEYISSAGLRILMKLRKIHEKRITVFEVSQDVYDIFESTGFTEMFNIQKRLREVSVEGCELLGKGGNGAVYRLDPETIVKVYYGERNSPEKIRQNRMVTKDVFLHGIPTTIAFDMVRVGENYGVVMEMIDARSMLREIGTHPEKLDEYAGMIADTLIKLHQTEFEEGTLPDSRDRARRDIKAIEEAGFLKPDEADRLYKLIDDIPYRNTFVHQDFHPGNMMLQNGEIVLIDVEDAGLGHPVLDLSSMYLVYVIAAEHGWGKEEGMDKKKFARLWDIIIRKYFDTDDSKKIKEINRILKGYAAIKFMRGVATSPTVPNIMRKPVIAESKKKLFSMIDTLHPIP